MIHAEEANLSTLEEEWNAVSDHTKWKLLPCYKPIFNDPTLVSESGDTTTLLEDAHLSDVNDSSLNHNTIPHKAIGTSNAAIVSTEPCFLGVTQPKPIPTKIMVISPSFIIMLCLYSKLDHLKTECAAIKPDIVCISETWLDSDIVDNELLIDDYKIIRLDRNRHEGGIALYIRHDLPHNIIFVGHLNFECIVVLLNVGVCKVCVCLLYRPPSSGIDVLDNLYDILCTLDLSLFSNFFTLGDFNIDFLSQTHPLFSKLFCISSSFFTSSGCISPHSLQSSRSTINY